MYWNFCAFQTNFLICKSRKKVEISLDFCVANNKNAKTDWNVLKRMKKLT